MAPVTTLKCQRFRETWGLIVEDGPINMMGVLSFQVNVLFEG